ncbi:MAG: hypothetical protein HUK40_14145 [Desulfobacter sp.]|nr:hypothetical protein [Desulfobacter sp.]
MSDMGVNLGNIQFYTETTGTRSDDQALDKVMDSIMDAVPEGVSREEVGKAIDDAIKANPDASMKEIMEAAVNTINTDHGVTSDASEISAMKAAWDDFTTDTGLTGENIKEILTDPVSFVLSDENTSEVSVKKMLAMLYLLMIEMAGEESANQLLEGCKQRYEIMEIAKEKAGDLRTKAWVSFAAGAISAGIQIYGGAKGLNAAKAGNSSLAQAYGGQSGAYNTIAGGFSGGVNAVAGLATGHIDAHIAELDGESQVAQANKELADKMRQKVGDLISNLINMLQSMSQTDYQTMITIGRA